MKFGLERASLKSCFMDGNEIHAASKNWQGGITVESKRGLTRLGNLQILRNIPFSQARRVPAAFNGVRGWAATVQCKDFGGTGSAWLGLSFEYLVVGLARRGAVCATQKRA